MRKKSTSLILGVLALLLVGGGLWFWQSGKVGHSVPEKKPEVRQPAKSGSTLTIYYPNRKYINSGDESLTKLLPKKVIVGDKSAAAAISKLKEAPTDPNMAPAIRKDLKILNVRVDKGIAYVNFSGTNLFGGSLEEIILVQSVVKTLTGIKGVQKVQFLVDGEVRETLMGHIETSDPIGEKDL